MLKRVPHPTTGLWWLALCIAAVGGTVSILLWLDRLNASHRYLAALTLTVTVVGIGICIISATAGWWMRR